MTPKPGFYFLSADRLEVAHDLPGGAARLLQGGRGFRAVFVNGERTVSADRKFKAPFWVR